MGCRRRLANPPRYLRVLGTSARDGGTPVSVSPDHFLLGKRSYWERFRWFDLEERRCFDAPPRIPFVRDIPAQNVRIPEEYPEVLAGGPVEHVTLQNRSARTGGPPRTPGSGRN